MTITPKGSRCNNVTRFSLECMLVTFSLIKCFSLTFQLQMGYQSRGISLKFHPNGDSSFTIHLNLQHINNFLIVPLYGPTSISYFDSVKGVNTLSRPFNLRSCDYLSSHVFHQYENF